MRPCPATDNLPADSAEIITLANFAPETCNGGLGTFCFFSFSLVSVCVFSGTALEDERTNWRLSIGAIGALTGPMYYLHASENTSVSHTHWNTQKHTLTKTGEKWYSHPPFTCANITYIRACSIIFLILCITLTSFLLQLDSSVVVFFPLWLPLPPPVLLFSLSLWLTSGAESYFYINL